MIKGGMGSFMNEDLNKRGINPQSIFNKVQGATNLALKDGVEIGKISKYHKTNKSSMLNC